MSIFLLLNSRCAFGKNLGDLVQPDPTEKGSTSNAPENSWICLSPHFSTVIQISHDAPYPERLSGLNLFSMHPQCVKNIIICNFSSLFLLERKISFSNLNLNLFLVTDKTFAEITLTAINSTTIRAWTIIITSQPTRPHWLSWPLG